MYDALGSILFIVDTLVGGVSDSIKDAKKYTTNIRVRSGLEMQMIKKFDKVSHVKDTNLKGVVVHVDENLKDITTCNIAWGCNTVEEALAVDISETDIQWTNKLIVLE